MFKTKEEIIIIQAETKEPIPTRAVFWSHDKGTAKMLFKLRKDGTSQSLAEGTIVPVVLDFNSDTAENGRGRHIYHAVIEDAVNGIVSIVLEDNILGYQGRVDGSIYIELPDSRSLDTAGRFTFHIKRSPIDEDVPELEDYYWQGFGEIMKQYHESIAEIKLEAKTTLDGLTADVTTAKTKVTQLEQSINTANTNLKTRIDEISKKIDDNDVFTKAESSANVINQISSDTPIPIVHTLLADKKNGTAYFYQANTFDSLSDSDYEKLLSKDGTIQSQTDVKGQGAEFKFTFNLIDVFENLYPSIFEGAQSGIEKIVKLKNSNAKISIDLAARGSGISTTENQYTNYCALYLNVSSGRTWRIWSKNSSELEPNQIEITDSYLDQIGADGQVTVFVVTKKNDNPDEGVISNGVTPAIVEVKNIKLTIELKKNGKQIIESMIAQNHVDNLATQTEATTATDNTKTMTPLRTKQLLDSKLLNMVYPIGSIYMSVNSATPATLFGGTWERFSKGRVLVGVDESDTVLATSGKQGGSTNPLTAHTHTTQLTTYRVTSGTGSGSVNNLGRATDLGDKMTGEFGSVTSTGDNTDHNNWQPFTTVYMWKRTA